ncbi:hypothetical protein Slin15195_G040010 [Septoria linicola]|uniref:Uncharacterized protein n=1 Tax=Septoria linicola TaxID=215465 RepID=A0A9Q9ARE2_9PEZI|nr:hypothetical protein Slin15195_G040010 [Septoria linicola]
MGSIFAPSDIEKLVANFPPLALSTNGRPPVVRSFSKNNLKNSAEVLTYFKALVERHDQKIDRSSLTYILGIEQSSENIILDQLDSQLYYSADGRYIIPHPLIENIAATLKERALRLAVDLHAFAREQDIRYDSLDRLIEEYSGKDWPRVIIDVDSTSYLCSYQYSEEIRTQVHNATSDAGLDICDLSSILGPSIPLPIVAALATEATAGKGGEVKYSGKRVIYVPQGHHEVAAERDAAQRNARVASLVAELKSNGYHALHETTEGFSNDSSGRAALEASITSEFGKTETPSLRPLFFNISQNAAGTTQSSKTAKDSTLIVLPETLQDELDAMKMAVGTRAGIIWRTEPTAATPANVVRQLQHSDFDVPHTAELADLLILSTFAKDLEATAQNCLNELESERNGQFLELVEARLWFPIHCFAAGTLEVQDATLKQHLQDFLTTHFKSDTVPSTISFAREQGFLNDKSRKREVDKLQKAVDEAKTFDDIQKTIAKFAKKLGIASPSESQVYRAKSSTLSQTVKSMQRMKRGSDVLQNLIWVLLATNGPGLFMSSGKDTSRMIKHYELICEDPEVAGMLAIWRDKLKAGLEDEEDIRQMKELAKSAFEEWAEEDKRRPYAGT